MTQQPPTRPHLPIEELSSNTWTFGECAQTLAVKYEALWNTDL